MDSRNPFPAASLASEDVVRDHLSPHEAQVSPSASLPPAASAFTASFLRKIKSSPSKEPGSVASPGSTKNSEPSSPKSKADATAAAMLSPVLSRVREQHRQAELQQAAEQNPKSDDQKPSGTGRSGLGFKTVAQTIAAFQHPARVPSHKGGEGVRRLVESREHSAKFLGLNTEYWDLSLFSISGRAWPVLPQVLYVVYCSVMVALVIRFVDNYTEARQFTGLQFPISTLGLALFLLLSFRTNSSYERWWEGRKIWEGISCKVQDMCRIAAGWVAPCERNLTPEQRGIASALMRWTLAFAFVAKKQLRVENDYPELAGMLSQADIEELEDEADPAAVVSAKITDLLYQCAHSAAVPPPIYNTMDGNIKGLNMDLGACQRILNTPMPFAYIVHLRSFMVLWLLGLPFAFVVTLGWYSIIVCTVVGYELLGFETIGVEIENPFGRDYNDLPLDMITTELFVKVANMLSKLGQQVDVEPILCMDPLRHTLHHHNMHHHHRSHSNSPKDSEEEPGEKDLKGYIRHPFSGNDADDAV